MELFLQAVIAESSCRVFRGGRGNILLSILVSCNSFNIINNFHLWIQANPNSLLLWPCRTNLRNLTAPSHLPFNVPISPAPMCSEEMPHLVQWQEAESQGSRVTCPGPHGKSVVGEGPCRQLPSLILHHALHLCRVRYCSSPTTFSTHFRFFFVQGV